MSLPADLFEIRPEVPYTAADLVCGKYTEMNKKNMLICCKFLIFYVRYCESAYSRFIIIKELIQREEI